MLLKSSDYIIPIDALYTINILDISEKNINKLQKVQNYVAGKYPKLK